MFLPGSEDPYNTWGTLKQLDGGDTVTRVQEGNLTDSLTK